MSHGVTFSSARTQTHTHTEGFFFFTRVCFTSCPYFFAVVYKPLLSTALCTSASTAPNSQDVRRRHNRLFFFFSNKCCSQTCASDSSSLDIMLLYFNICCLSSCERRSCSKLHIIQTYFDSHSNMEWMLEVFSLFRSLF